MSSAVTSIPGFIPTYTTGVGSSAPGAVSTQNKPDFRNDSGLNEPRLFVAVVTLPEKTLIPGAGHLRLQRSVVAELEMAADGFILRSPDLDEESWGRAADDALWDFLTSLRDRHQSLRQRESRLSAQDRQVLTRLQLILGTNVAPTEGPTPGAGVEG